MKTRVDCPHARVCPGCPLIDRAIDEQQAMKHARVRDAVAAYPALRDVAIAAVVAADPIEGYRGRAKLIVSQAPDGVKIGLFTRGTAHEVVDLPGCRVLSPELSATVAVLRRRLAGASGAVARVRAVDTRACSSRDGLTRVLVTLVAERDDVSHGADLAALRAFAVELIASTPNIAGVALNLRATGSHQLLGTEQLSLAGVDELPDAIDGVEHLATFGAFVQAHRGQAAQAHRAIVDAVGVEPGAHVLDLYGGSGAIGLALAANGARVTVVESFEPAAARAIRAGKKLVSPLGGSLTARAGDVERVLGVDAKRDLRDARAVVVNPPRRGLAPGVRTAIATLDVATIAYLSCDPDTLARDLDHFATLGYAAAALTPFDMIPLTDHVETLAVLRRVPPALPHRYHRDDALVAVEQRAHDARPPDLDHPSQRCALDVSMSGVALWARGDAGGAVAGAWSEYTVLVKGRTLDAGKFGDAGATYVRTASVAGHSLLRVRAGDVAPRLLRRALAKLGHPVIGDARDGHAPTNRLFSERNTLERAFMHRTRLVLPARALDLHSALAGDLECVLRRCRAQGVTPK